MTLEKAYHSCKLCSMAKGKKGEEIRETAKEDVKKALEEVLDNITYSPALRLDDALEICQKCDYSKSKIAEYIIAIDPELKKMEEWAEVFYCSSCKN